MQASYPVHPCFHHWIVQNIIIREPSLKCYFLLNNPCMSLQTIKSCISTFITALQTNANNTTLSILFWIQIKTSTRTSVTSFGSEVLPAARLNHGQVSAVNCTVAVVRIRKEVEAGPRLVQQGAVAVKFHLVTQRHAVPAGADDDKHVPRALDLDGVEHSARRK